MLLEFALKEQKYRRGKKTKSHVCENRIEFFFLFFFFFSLSPHDAS